MGRGQSPLGYFWVAAQSEAAKPVSVRRQEHMTAWAYLILQADAWGKSVSQNVGLWDGDDGDGSA